MVYQWRDGARFGAPAQAVGERLDAIRERSGGNLTPDPVIDDARSPDSPMHPLFNWDESEAAREHWREVARHIIRSVRVVSETPEGATIEAGIRYVHVVEADAGPCYVTTARALSDADLRAQVLADARRGLKSWRERYGHLKELARVIEVVDGELGEDGQAA